MFVSGWGGFSDVYIYFDQWVRLFVGMPGSDWFRQKGCNRQKLLTYFVSWNISLMIKEEGETIGCLLIRLNVASLVCFNILLIVVFLTHLIENCHTYWMGWHLSWQYAGKIGSYWQGSELSRFLVRLNWNTH